MALIPWRPFDEFFDEDDFFLPLVHRGRMAEPAMDLYESGDNLIAEFTLPNIDPDKVDVTVEDQVLRVSGKTETEEEESDQDRGYWRREIRKGSFERSVHLPSPVQEEKVAADYENGMLKVTMPKAGEKKGKKVKVEAKSK